MGSLRPASAADAAAKWHVDREFRRPLFGADGHADADSVAFSFCGGGHIATGGRDILVVDETGAVLPSRVLFTRKGAQTWVAYRASKAKGRVWVYYGGGKTDGHVSTSGWRPKLSLMLITMPRPAGALKSHRPIASAAKGSKIHGMGFVPQIWSGVNPYGPDDNFASAHIGYLKIPQTGRYRIFTASDEASFVLLKGKELVSWPGKHTVDKGRRGEQGVTLRLVSGVYRIEYYHVEYKGIQFMALGWKRPGKKELKPIPEEAFLHTPIAKADSPERRADKPLAACHWVQDDQLLYGKYQFTRIRFADQCRNLPPGARVKWDFGDGTRYTGNAGDHIYVGDGPFPCTITAIDKQDKPIARFHTVVRTVAALKNATVQDDRELREYVSAIIHCNNARAPRRVLDAYWQLVETEEDVRESRSFIETYVDKYGASGNMWHAADRLALFYALEDAKKAVGLYAKLTTNAPTKLDAARARMEQIELILHKLKDPDRALKVAQTAKAMCSGLERRIAAVKIGDVYRAQGDLENAEKAYRAAQQVSYRMLDRRVVAVRRGGFLETANSHTERGQLRAAREALVLWEAEYPIGKLSGDLPLMTAKYFDKLGDPVRALAELTTLVKINPLSPYLPEVEFYMARAYARLGEMRKARQLLDKVMSEYPRSRAARLARTEGL